MVGANAPPSLFKTQKQIIMEIYILKITRYLEHEQALRLNLRHDDWAGIICGTFKDRNTAIYLAREYNRKQRNRENRLYYTVEKDIVRTFKI